VFCANSRMKGKRSNCDFEGRGIVQTAPQWGELSSEKGQARQQSPGKLEHEYKKNGSERVRKSHPAIPLIRRQGHAPDKNYLVGKKDLVPCLRKKRESMGRDNKKKKEKTKLHSSARESQSCLGRGKGREAGMGTYRTECCDEMWGKPAANGLCRRPKQNLKRDYNSHLLRGGTNWF